MADRKGIMSKQRMKTEGQQFAYEIMCYMKEMYPEIMKQSKSFNTSLKNSMAIKYDSWQEQKRKVVVRPARSPIEIMVDQACGFMEPPKK